MISIFGLVVAFVWVITASVALLVYVVAAVASLFRPRRRSREELEDRRRSREDLLEELEVIKISSPCDELNGEYPDPPLAGPTLAARLSAVERLERVSERLEKVAARLEGKA